MCILGSFAGALLEGRDPASARVVSSSTRVALEQLEKWAARQTTAADVLVMEASGNAFAVAARLRAMKRQVVILDSHQAGKVGKAYCANDRVDAVKIARIYLSGLTALVWQPDPRTLERREVFSAYQGVVKESTRLKQQLKAMLNEHCVRLPKGFRLSHLSALVRLSKFKAYLGLNPSVSQSGNWEGGGALKRHGRGALRTLLVQAAKR